MNTQEAISKIISNILAQKDGDDLKLQDIAMINESHELLTVIAVFAKEHELTMTEIEKQLSVITKFIRTAETQLVDTTVDLLLSQDTGMTMFADGVKVRYKKGELAAVDSFRASFPTKVNAAVKTYEEHQDNMDKVFDSSPTTELQQLIKKAIVERKNELSRKCIKEEDSEYREQESERIEGNFHSLKFYDTFLKETKEILENEPVENYANALVNLFGYHAYEANVIVQNRRVTLDVKNRI